MTYRSDRLRGEIARQARLFIPLLVLLALSPCSTPAYGDVAVNRPFPQHVKYAPGVILPTSVPQAAMDAAVQAYYRDWRKTYVKTVPGTEPAQKYVEHEPGNTVSEAVGYGMVISAYLANHEDFDAMFFYVKAHRSRIGPRLMAWKQVNSRGRMVNVEGVCSATDGDLDIAYALLLADRQWGSSGVINYKAEALVMMGDILAYDVNPKDWHLLCGDWAHKEDPNHTRPSDFMVDHLLAFAAADPAHSSQWMKAYNQICAIVNYQFNSGGSAHTALLPDFMVKSGSHFVPVPGKYLETVHDGDFDYNACRTPWRLPMAYIVAGRTDLLPALTAQNSWIQAVSGSLPGKIKAGYYIKNGINGTPYAADGDLCFTAPFAVLAMIDSKNQNWLNKLWISITGGDYGAVTNYYNDSIRLQVLLVLSGNWWLP